MRTIKLLTMLLLLGAPAIGCRATPAAQADLPPGDPAVERPETSSDQIYHANKNSVVSMAMYFPIADSNLTGVENGAGTIISRSGLVLSNWHLTRHGGRTGEAIFHDGRRFPIRLLAGDQQLDVAVYQIDAWEAFSPVKFGRSSELRPGEPAIAMGNPHGGGLTTTAGVISAVGVHWGYAREYFPAMIATDALIRPGNSGGALFNGKGEYVGITAGTLNNAKRMSYAIPIDAILSYLPDILAMNGLYRFKLGLTVDTDRTGLVTDVRPDSPAERAGVRVGDIVTHVGDVRVDSRIAFHLALLGYKGGDELKLTLDRDGEIIPCAFKLDEPELHPAVQVDDAVGGVNVEFYQGQWQQLPDFTTLTPLRTYSSDTVTAGPHEGTDFFALRIRGYLKVPRDGTYAFFLASDDGSRLSIDGRIVVDNDGLHGWYEQRAGHIALAAGLHRIEVGFFEATGNEGVALRWKGPGFELQDLPASVLFREPTAEEQAGDQ